MSWDKFIIVSDSHGDNESPEAVDAFFKFLKIWKPIHRIHAGDAFDLRPLRTKASEEEKRESILLDFNTGLGFLERLKPNVYTRGNHCERLFDMANNGHGMLKEFCKGLTDKLEEKIDKFRCVMLPYHKREGIFNLGKLKVLHGYTCGPSAARESARTYGSCVIGHGHQIQSASIPGLEYRVGRMIGCMCRLDLDYNRAIMSSLGQAHGFGYGVVDSKSGEFQIWQAESVNGRWLLPSGIKEI